MMASDAVIEAIVQRSSFAGAGRWKGLLCARRV